MPVATTDNVALAPAVTVTLLGWVEIEGATVPELTVNVAAFEVVEPPPFVTTQVYDPASAVVVLAIV